MERKGILPLVVVLILVTIFTNVLADDDVKHKRVIVRVPKKINHIHHHHVKKVHVYKHKPKPIHSIHVVEEVEPIGDKWKNAFKKKRNQFSHLKEELGSDWKYGGEDEEEYGLGTEDEEEDEGYHESESHDEPIVWKGKKNKGKQNPRGGSSKGKTGGRQSLKDGRPKRQKNLANFYRQDSYYRQDLSAFSPHSLKKPKQANRPKKSKKHFKKPKPKPPADKEYSDYGEYYDEGQLSGSPVWPERKEHISWHHAKGNNWKKPLIAPPVTEIPGYSVEDYRTEHSGEINLSKPEIQVIQAPQLGPHKIIQDLHFWSKHIGLEPSQWAQIIQNPHTQSWTTDLVQKPQSWPHDNSQKQSWPHVNSQKQSWPHEDSQKQLWSQENSQKQSWSQEDSQKQSWSQEDSQKQSWPHDASQKQFWSHEDSQKQLRPHDGAQQMWVQENAKLELPLTKAAQDPQLLVKTTIKEPLSWEKEVIHVPPQRGNHGAKAPKKSAVNTNRRPRTKKPIVKGQEEVLNKRQEGLHTKVEHSGTGYTSHVGHSPDGDSSSFQSVRFGDVIKHS